MFQIKLSNCMGYEEAGGRTHSNGIWARRGGRYGGTERRKVTLFQQHVTYFITLIGRACVNAPEVNR